MPNIRKTIKMIKKHKIIRKPAKKLETIEKNPKNQDNAQIKTEIKVKEEEINDRKCIFNLPKENLSLYQNQMAFCLQKPFGVFPNLMFIRPWI